MLPVASELLNVGADEIDQFSRRDKTIVIGVGRAGKSSQHRPCESTVSTAVFRTLIRNLGWPGGHQTQHFAWSFAKLHHHAAERRRLLPRDAARMAHVGEEDDASGTVELILHHGMKPGVVLNPATRVDLIIDILPMVHHVLIMSVNPGFGGQEFIPFSLNKIRRLVELRSDLDLDFRIEVDGGVAHDTVAAIVQAGAELLVAGNAVFGAGEPERDARALLAAAREADDRIIASRVVAGKSKIH